MNVETRETLCWKCHTPNTFVVSATTTRVNCRNGCGAMLFSRTPEGTVYVVGSAEQEKEIRNGPPLDDRIGHPPVMSDDWRRRADDLLRSVLT